jgi:DNA-binding MarR family transcriptional regulator/GNAT superfamily N-acetyltransferase
MSRVIEDVRGFNRFYTRVIGLLQPDLAGSAFGLTEARVLFELAHADDIEVSDLRRRLDLDAGYLSRILTGFTTARLVTKEQSASDGRRQIVRLTDDGKRAFAELDRLQTVALDKLLAPLDGTQRSDLVAAMGRIRRTLGDEPSWAGLVFRPPAPGDLGWVVAQHGHRYAADYGWDLTFEALVARIVADFAERNDTRREAAWIAEVDGERVGSVFCTCSERPNTALMRLLLVEPSARGAGIGTRLVDECLRFARRAGYTRILLWTNDVLANARSIYLRAGFQLDRRDPHHSFGHDLVGEYWSREL